MNLTTIIRNSLHIRSNLGSRPIRHDRTCVPSCSNRRHPFKRPVCFKHIRGRRGQARAHIFPLARQAAKFFAVSCECPAAAPQVIRRNHRIYSLFTMFNTPRPAKRLSMTKDRTGHEFVCLRIAGSGFSDQMSVIRRWRSSLTPDPCRLTAEPGGARRDRTDDLMLAKHALSQLSYCPEGSGFSHQKSEKPAS